MSHTLPPYLLAPLLLLAGCLESSSGHTPSRQALPAEPDALNAVWTVDLVRTLPGQQAEYLRNIEANWTNARRIARERGVVLSYRALVAPPDTARGWDVMLMTEYADSAAWEDRETIFQDIFSSPEYVRVPMTRPSSEVREFAAGGVVMQALVSGPPH